jgi:hypothetical protein
LLVNNETEVISPATQLICGHGPEKVFVDSANLARYPVQVNRRIFDWDEGLTHACLKRTLVPCEEPSLAF